MLSLVKPTFGFLLIILSGASFADSESSTTTQKGACSAYAGPQGVGAACASNISKKSVASFAGGKSATSAGSTGEISSSSSSSSSGNSTGNHSSSSSSSNK